MAGPMEPKISSPGDLGNFRQTVFQTVFLCLSTFFPVMYLRDGALIPPSIGDSSKTLVPAFRGEKTHLGEIGLS